jgi:hypothetical protein
MSSFLINNAFLWVLFIFLCVPRISWVVIINQLLIKNISHSMHVDGLMRDIISLRSSNVFRFACYNISRILTAMELTYVSQYSFVLFSVKEELYIFLLRVFLLLNVHTSHITTTWWPRSHGGCASIWSRVRVVMFGGAWASFPPLEAMSTYEIMEAVQNNSFFTLWLYIYSGD